MLIDEFYACGIIYCVIYGQRYPVVMYQYISGGVPGRTVADSGLGRGLYVQCVGRGGPAWRGVELVSDTCNQGQDPAWV